MKVPLFDMTRQYESIRNKVLNTLDEVFKSGKVVLGKHVKSLEANIEKYMKVKNAVGVANGSDALVIAVKALNLTPGDYIITTPYTFFATASCIVRNGLIPIFVDIEEKYYNIDLNEVEKVLKTHPQKEKIKAIIPVHLFGKTIDMKKLLEIKERYNLKVIEDTAQAIGAVWYDGNKKVYAGTASEFGTISFFPTKNLGGYGDGGMIVSNNTELAQKARYLRVHGASKKYYHDEVGYNSRLDEVQAAVLDIKLKQLDEYIEKRINVAKTYKKLFTENGLNEYIEYPEVFEDKTHVYHQYVITLKNESRDELFKYLKENEVGTSIYYPKGLHLQKCFEDLGYSEGDFPVTEKACKTTIALPIFPELTLKEQEYVVETIKKFFKGE